MILSRITNFSNSTYKDEPGKAHSDNPPGQDLVLLLLVKSVRGATISFPAFGFSSVSLKCLDSGTPNPIFLTFSGPTEIWNQLSDCAFPEFVFVCQNLDW